MMHQQNGSVKKEIKIIKGIKRHPGTEEVQLIKIWIEEREDSQQHNAYQDKIIRKIEKLANKNSLTKALDLMTSVANPPHT